MPPPAFLGIPVTANRSPRRSTAQAILASLLAKATIATLRLARLESAFAHGPSGVPCYLLPRLLIPNNFGLPQVVN